MSFKLFTIAEDFVIFNASTETYRKHWCVVEIHYVFVLGCRYHLKSSSLNREHYTQYFAARALSSLLLNLACKLVHSFHWVIVDRVCAIVLDT